MRYSVEQNRYEQWVRTTCAAGPTSATNLRQNAVKCCIELRSSEIMAAKRGRRPSDKPRATRASASLPPELYAMLQEIAKQKKVSVAWVIRDAAEKYIAEQWPLFAQT